MAEADVSLQAASLVVEHIVPSGEGMAFRWWHSKVARAAKNFEGHIRTDLCSPVKGQQPNQPMKWYSIVHFESPQLLNQWVNSSDRSVLINAGRKTFASYQFISFSTGLEGWFSRRTGTEQSGLGPPAWKQNAAVILALYPTVIVQTLLFSALGVMQSWALPNAMIINNIITSSVLTWGVMPLVTKFLGFWLQPNYQPTAWKKDALGAAVVTGALGLMVLLFNQF
ncbi:MAG: hypothetical protein WBG38_16835 [Nodosilinea sp.]